MDARGGIASKFTTNHAGNVIGSKFRMSAAQGDPAHRFKLKNTHKKSL